MMTNIEKWKWEQRFDEVQHNQDRLINLMNDFYYLYRLEIDAGLPRYRNFYEKVVSQLETVAV